ncbi:MAG: universal stress protein [Zhengella sp.]|uniref:universal stress protein n=1 Tax=Zhengella sp. TaxID=2282762 RepID=UPI001DF3CC36|nr:universal stress protein [Notoacmeibacter sp.]MCC0027585.1 universal stress protein [Brucellaceae bacterium]
MSERFVVGYDGSAPARRALDFAIGKARAQGARIIVAHVLEWSPYSFLTPTELEERHMRRKEELARAQEAILDPVIAEVRGLGIETEGVIRYGHVADTLTAIIRDREASQIFIGRSGNSELSSRIFGSVAGSLAQSAPVPCTIVP